MLTLCGYRHYNVTERLYSHDEKELKLELQKVKDWYLIPRYNIVLSELFESGSSLYPDMIGYLRPTCENYCLIGDYLCRKQNNAAAEGYYSRASEMIPTRMTPLYKLWKLYMYENRYVEAKTIAEKILSMEIKAEGTKTIRMRNEVKKYINENN